MRTIPLIGKYGKGLFASVSDEDFEYLTQWEWFLTIQGYVVRSEGHGHIRMHRIVCIRAGHEVTGLDVDHKYGDKLDNQRESLRPATRSQNLANQKVRKDNNTGVKGVSWKPKYQRYFARITFNGKSKNIGYFKTLDAARVAYEAQADLLHGEFARKNG